MIMHKLESIRDALPDAARDIKLNLQSVLDTSSLSVEQRWGVALASAIAARNRSLRDAVHEAARATTSATTIDDAIAAAALMAMNNVYYRFRHHVAKPEYADKPARLRMNRIARPAGDKTDFELYCLAVSAINGCETCVRAHEKTVITAGMRDDQVNDAIRIAATIHAAAVALEASVAA
jgi:alkyl hydroperoxide reductase subunit D